MSERVRSQNVADVFTIRMQLLFKQNCHCSSIHSYIFICFATIYFAILLVEGTYLFISLWNHMKDDTMSQNVANIFTSRMQLLFKHHFHNSLNP